MIVDNLITNTPLKDIAKGEGAGGGEGRKGADAMSANWNNLNFKVVQLGETSWFTIYLISSFYVPGPSKDLFNN